MIEQFYLMQKWDSNRYYRSGSELPASNGNEGVLHIPQSITFRCSLLSYLGHSLEAGRGTCL